jgi:hypothetical protein
MKQKDNMPLLVYWGLYGINSRILAQGFMWLCVFLAAGFVSYGFVSQAGYQGAVFIFAAAWYWYAINWVDTHSSWDKS